MFRKVQSTVVSTYDRVCMVRLSMASKTHRETSTQVLKNSVKLLDVNLL